ncbi:MAG TPA: thioredoxin domain-containing protein [Pyrinomonadaceae bacterium]|nr:thioredoxin domain-containing protein [Pyrinomonadaceae bacterium]
MKRYLPFIIIALVLVGAVVLASILWRRGNTGGDSNSILATTKPPAPLTSNSPAPSDSSPVPVPTKPNFKVSSPVVLEEYGDYQCPPCGLLYPELKKIEGEYGNQVQIIFHHFPLMKMHKNALAAAHAAEAARNQNKFWEMHDRLYRNQNAWVEQEDPRPVFVSYARELGLNVERFRSDMESNQVDQRISADIQRGTSQGVTGTPTVFLDSHLLRYEATNAEGLRRGINLLLESKPRS